MPPLAALLAPNAFPLGFTEVVAFRRDFGGTEVVNPKGIAYHAALNCLIVSISPSSFGQGQRVQMLNSVAANGARTRFAVNYDSFRFLPKARPTARLSGTCRAIRERGAVGKRCRTAAPPS